MRDKRQKATKVIITHQSYSDPLEKDLCIKQPPSPLVIDSFLTSPPPLGISVALRGGLWIFSATTHYTCQREAVEWKKSFKILQTKEPCYENDKQSSHWLLIQLTVLLIFVTIISPGQRSRYTVFFCRNKMLRKGDDTCPVESCIGFQPRRPYEKAWQGWKELITFQILVGSTHKPQ